MKKLLITSIIAMSTNVAFAGETITFAMEPTYPPFELTNEKGEVIGFEVDLAKAICAELKAECQFKKQSFDSLIAGLKFKRFDAIISAMDITPERSKQVLFSAPYYDSSASFIAVKGKADLASAKNIGVQNGTTFQQYISKNAKQYAMKPYATLQSAILDLQNGRIDIVFGDTAVLSDALKKYNDLQFVGDKVTDKAYFGNGFGIAVNKSNQTLLDKINSTLATIKSNGKYEQIYKAWMDGK